MYFKCLTSLSIFGLLSAARDSRPVERIIGGHSILIEHVPWQVSLLSKMSHICGGAIQSDRVILTAGHCLENEKLEDLSIRAGSSVLKKGGQVVKVLKAIPHEKYVHGSVPFDFALLILESPLKFNSRVQKIDIADETPPVGNMTLVTGWGCTNFDANFNWPILQGVHVKVVECENENPDMICTDTRRGTACSGDSGGPLVRLTDFKLIGIVSRGTDVHEDGRGFYANTVSVIDWISSTVTENIG